MILSKGVPKAKWHYLLRLALFWLLYFTLFRLIFIGFQTRIPDHPGITSMAWSFIAGFKLDLSTISYLMLPSFLLWAIRQWWSERIIAHINTGYHFTLLFFMSILGVATIKMYHSWQTLLNFSVFHYLAYPNEVLSFISFGELFMLILLCILYFICSVWLYKKIVIRFTSAIGAWWARTAIILLLPGVFVIAARGGLQLIPINESSAYFSKIPFYNHVAVNPTWYFIHSFLETDSGENPYRFMEMAEATKRHKHLLLKSELPSDTILTTSRPNIVIILLESWVADIIESLGGEQCVTPYFDSLRKEGVLFTQIYSPGNRTEHSLASVLSGYPAAPRKSIINITYKAEKLKNINTILKKEGYHSSFYYGGEIGFAHMKSYLLNAHFHTIIDKESFEEDQWNSKWGAHDEYVFTKQLHDLQNTPEPFFSVLLTLSSHEPFEVPMEKRYTGNKEPDQFRNAVYYTDRCLAAYFKEARKQPWYANTLFILVADHGQRLPKRLDLNLPRSQHIPLLFVGEVIKSAARGTTVDKVANQNDIAATLLNQLHLEDADFPLSKDLLNPGTKEFAYYTNDNVMGWVTSRQKFIYFYTNGEVKMTEPLHGKTMVQDSLLRDAKAYLQAHYQWFLMY